MAGLNGYGCTGTLTIGSTSMNNPAWDITDLTPLWATVEVRGQDRIIPGAAGAIPYQRRLTVTRHDLQMLITGDVNASGTPFANPDEGLQSNLSTLYTNVIAPVGSGGGTRAATLTLPSGATRTADIHIIGFVRQQTFVSDSQAIMEATLQISIPEGRFS
jgi:hypothetical protein